MGRRWKKERAKSRERGLRGAKKRVKRGQDKGKRLSTIKKLEGARRKGKKGFG